MAQEVIVVRIVLFDILYLSFIRAVRLIYGFCSKRIRKLLANVGKDLRGAEALTMRKKAESDESTVADGKSFQRENKTVNSIYNIEL